MPDLLTTPDGRVHTLFSPDDLAELVADYAGEDVASKVRAEQDRNAYDEARAETDLRAYEEDLEHLRRQIQDWAETMGGMIEDLHDRRVSKHEIAEAAAKLKKQIEEEL